MAKKTIRLLDYLGVFEDTADCPEPLPVVYTQGGKAYLRFGVDSIDYRQVSFHASNDTPASGVFRVLREPELEAPKP